MTHLVRRLTPAALFLVLSPLCAHAQCPGTTPLWSHVSELTSLVSNTSSSLLGRSYHASGSAVYAYRNSNEAGNQAGTRAWVWAPLPDATTINNFPSPVPMHTGGEYIYLGATNGRLYKLDAASGASAGSADTRRAGCAADQLQATPTIQLYAYSNAAYQSVHNRDLVIVPTHTGCGDQTKNRIIAYDASNLSVQWIFNDTGIYPMDYASEGCALDYANNRVYCGTNDGGAQQTLWAINTISGALVWSGNAGSVQNRPQLCNNRLYVASKPGQLMAYNPNTGTPLWPVPVLLGSAVVRNPWVEFRNGFTNIYVTTADGYLRAYRDVGTGAIELWPADNAGGVGYASMPVVAPPPLNKVYIARNDGRVQQIDADSGQREVSVDAAPAGTVFDPALDVQDAADLSPNRLLVASTHVLHRYCIPWSAEVGVRDEFQPERQGATLRPNVPNPFRESTRIDYELSRPGRVEIQLFNVAGTRLRTWTREHSVAGAQSLVWDGTDEAGLRAPSGVYFCRLRVKDGGATTLRSRTVLRLE